LNFTGQKDKLDFLEDLDKPASKQQGGKQKDTTNETYPESSVSQIFCNS
jgi:hypothetical protein